MIAHLRSTAFRIDLTVLALATMLMPGRFWMPAAQYAALAALLLPTVFAGSLHRRKRLRQGLPVRSRLELDNPFPLFARFTRCRLRLALVGAALLIASLLSAGGLPINNWPPALVPVALRVAGAIAFSLALSLTLIGLLISLMKLRPFAGDEELADAPAGACS